MKKYFKTVLLGIVFAIALSGCGTTKDAETDQSSPSLISEPINSQTASDSVEGTSGTIKERKSVDGKKQSYLTGEWKDEAIVDRRPMAVMIPNNEAALPQYGISKASVVYEAPMEALCCTRLMGIFEDYDELDHIGPIRSSRLYFLQEAMSFDAIYCNWGLAIPYVGDLINSDRVDNVSAAVAGIDVPADEAFDRDADRKAAGYATEYTGIMTIEGYEEAVSRLGYDTGYRDSFEQDFLFADDGYISKYDIPITFIAPGGKDSSYAGGGYESALPYFEYDENTHLYTRYQFGEPMVDEYNGETLTYTNVILKVCKGDYVDANGYLGIDVIGEGGCYLFTEGTMVTGTWTRSETDGAATYYRQEDGTEFVLNQGKTWICIILENSHDYVVIE